MPRHLFPRAPGPSAARQRGYAQPPKRDRAPLYPARARRSRSASPPPRAECLACLPSATRRGVPSPETPSATTRPLKPWSAGARPDLRPTMPGKKHPHRSINNLLCTQHSTEGQFHVQICIASSSSTVGLVSMKLCALLISKTVRSGGLVRWPASRGVRRRLRKSNSRLPGRASRAALPASGGAHSGAAQRPRTQAP